MPAFYPRPMADAMPLTPPDSGSGHGYSRMHYGCQDHAYNQSSMGQARHDAPYDYQQSYMHPAVAPAPPTYSSYAQQGNGFQSGNNLPPIHYYESMPINAPTLPPLRIQDSASFTDSYQRSLRQEQHNAAAREQQQRQAAKEEKPVGGVSAKLDYDMDVMTDYVVGAAQSIFRYTMHSVPSFRKWVFQVLSATRLPSSTILLSLHFLNDRILNQPDSVLSGENQIYRLLAVSLILGSKFLDDNTFINRSWSDVTALKVSELNLLEMQWLQLREYRLHVDPETPSGLKAWLDSWRRWKEQNSHSSHAYNGQTASARLSPLNTHAAHRQDRFSPYPSPYSAHSSRFPEPQSSASTSSRVSAYANSTAPSSATSYASADPWQPDHRTHLDDFYKRQNRFPTLSEIDDANRRYSAEAERSRNMGSAHNSHSSASYHHGHSYQSSQQQQQQHQSSSSFYHPQTSSAASSAYNSPWGTHDAWGSNSSSNNHSSHNNSNSGSHGYHSQQYYGGSGSGFGSAGAMHHHRADCSCSFCAYQQPFSRPWPAAASYAAQTVMG